MKIDEKKLVEVIGRLRGRAISHLNAAQQTTNAKKAEAHISAHQDLISLRDDLANATDNPKWVKSRAAYNWSVGITPTV